MTDVYYSEVNTHANTKAEERLEKMLTSTVIIVIALMGSNETEPAYVLDYPGIAFGWLSEEFNPPVEGTLTVEAGVIASGPNNSGLEYHLYYWQENLVPNTRKDEWLEERFRSIISPDLLPHLLQGTPEWIEGSLASPFRESGSLGLVPVMNFNIVTDEGDIVGKGKSCAIFCNGYSMLFYGIAPMSSDAEIRSDLERMISLMYRIES